MGLMVKIIRVVRETQCVGRLSELLGVPWGTLTMRYLTEKEPGKTSITEVK